MSQLESKTNHYYLVQSKARSIGQSEIDFTVPAHRLNHIRSFKLKEAIVPYSWYNVNSNYNRLIIRKNGDTEDRTATIAVGRYNLSQLKAELKTQLDALAGPAQTYTITDSKTSYKLTITQDSSSFIYKGNSTINRILGFADEDSADLISHTGPYIYNLSGSNYIELYSNQLTKYDTRIRKSDGQGSDLLAVVAVSDYAFGNTIRIPFDDYIYDYHDKSEGDIDIRILDEFGNQLGGSNTLNGQNIALVLQYHTVKNNNPNVLNRHHARNFRNSGYGNIIN